MVARDCSRQCILNKASNLSENWEAMRQKLLERRICDFRLAIAGSSVEPLIEQLEKELLAKEVNYVPSFYLTDTWGCPDKVPIVGIPFYLCCNVLGRIEKDLTGELEDPQTVMQLLRHEAGHAVNYAFRLWKEPQWKETFGPFSKPYREVFYPNPRSRRFVRHINSYAYGTAYAQKHPDDDFAETFAVWLTPRSGWRRKYQDWPAIKKLKYVDRLMKQICEQEPKYKSRKRLRPVSKLTMSLAQYYGNRLREYSKTS
jgi:hypothetical protein